MVEMAPLPILSSILYSLYTNNLQPNFQSFLYLLAHRATSSLILSQFILSFKDFVLRGNEDVCYFQPYSHKVLLYHSGTPSDHGGPRTRRERGWQ